jgi:hypothetical protein
MCCLEFTPLEVAQAEWAMVVVMLGLVCRHSMLPCWKYVLIFCRAAMEVVSIPRNGVVGDGLSSTAVKLYAAALAAPIEDALARECVLGTIQVRGSCVRRLFH